MSPFQRGDPAVSPRAARAAQGTQTRLRCTSAAAVISRCAWPFRWPRGGARRDHRARVARARRRWLSDGPEGVVPAARGLAQPCAAPGRAPTSAARRRGARHCSAHHRRGRGRVRHDRDRELDRDQARERERRRPAAGQLRGRARDPVARDHLRLAGGPPEGREIKLWFPGGSSPARRPRWTSRSWPPCRSRSSATACARWATRWRCRSDR